MTISLFFDFCISVETFGIKNKVDAIYKASRHLSVKMYVIFEMLYFGKLKRLCISNFIIKEIKGHAMTSNKQNFRMKFFRCILCR